MTTYLIPGLLGLLTGLILHWGRLSQADGLRAALGLRRSLTLRTSLTALGWGTLLTALLMWLAVLDVDAVTVLPLSLGALLGGLVFGVCAGLSGFTPTTAFAGLGAGNAPEALCVLAGCLAGTWLPAGELLHPLRQPWLASTLFKVTLDEPYLFEGGFLGMGCLGALLIVWGICVPSPKGPHPSSPEGEATFPKGEGEASPTVSAPEESPEPESAPEETVVLALEGEKPLVVDTGMDEVEAEPTSATAVGEGLAPPGPAQSPDEDGDAHRDLE